MLINEIQYSSKCVHFCNFHLVSRYRIDLLYTIEPQMSLRRIFTDFACNQEERNLKEILGIGIVNFANNERQKCSVSKQYDLTKANMPDHLGEDMRKVKNEEEKEEKEIKCELHFVTLLSILS